MKNAVSVAVEHGSDQVLFLAEALLTSDPRVRIRNNRFRDLVLVINYDQDEYSDRIFEIHEEFSDLLVLDLDEYCNRIVKDGIIAATELAIAQLRECIDSLD